MKTKNQESIWMDLVNTLSPSAITNSRILIQWNATSKIILGGVPVLLARNSAAAKAKTGKKEGVRGMNLCPPECSVWRPAVAGPPVPFKIGSREVYNYST